MNYTIILLVVVVIVLIFILRTTVFKYSGKLSDKIALSNTNTVETIIDNPTSYRFAYGVWIYMNSWNTIPLSTGNYNLQNNNIFNRGSKIQLYLDEKTPTLYFYVKTVNNDTPITVTTNFPIQKWVYFVANVDGQYIDLYLNGKLIKSVKLNSLLAQPSPDAKVVTGGSLDGFAAKLHHWSHPLTPKDVWSNYMNGNGGNSLTKMFSSYGVDVALVKDNVEQKSIRLF